MHISLLLSCFLLAATDYFLGCAHMIPDERLSTSRVSASNALSQNLEIDSPPVVIVELPKSAKKSKKPKKQKKNKYGVKKRPPPPANCISLWGSCKSQGTVCCDYCAFCQCRLFRTVCYCRMGNPRC
ncbi:agouti signaling protein 1 [Maylandia zebra]|uniref:Agouti-signaling protein n=3 Tax=Haplochromini TaxID=319058 RepID=T2C5A4_HAPBU|nr:agouti signaling protein 1 precursor [Haplochromis burtoni]XP_004548896.1 agouti-signaling protein [Maylandia zebra]XP_014194147.1 agouti signaling protein 1 isoform X1 [Haplochromis burtoni]XP_026023112.1 agouti-signaling protein [Astatotilapia calliptera]XP_039859775.1 agouti signaling protein 1 [Simochromis diagramma]AGV20969.1 agouti signaling peptide 1 [Haplochromis burtoni]